MKATQYIFILLILVIASCSKRKSNEEIRSMNQPERPISVLKELVLKKGDIEAYEELRIAYLDYHHGDFYEIAKTMADKYDFPSAYYDVYIQILEPTQRRGTSISLDSCTTNKKEEAIRYLKKAFEKGFEPAGEELQNLKDEGFIK